MEWIKFTKESLPKNDQNVLITDGQVVVFATFNLLNYLHGWDCWNAYGFRSWDYDWEFKEITHLMQLPELPTVGCITEPKDVTNG